jgi:hypothetical protein
MLVSGGGFHHYRNLQTELARAGIAASWGPKAQALTDLTRPVIVWVVVGMVSLPFGRYRPSPHIGFTIWRDTVREVAM